MAVRLVLRWRSGDHDLLHRVRNMGEDVFRLLPDEGIGEASIAEIDASRDHFFVSVSGKRNVGRATQLLGRILKKHNLQDDVRIEAADG